jgi:hypothetical protein
MAVGVRSYADLRGDCDNERGAMRFGCAHCRTESLAMKRRWELQESRWLASRRRLRHVVTHLHVLALSLRMSRVEDHQATVTSDSALTREKPIPDQRDLLLRKTSFQQHVSGTLFSLLSSDMWRVADTTGVVGWFLCHRTLIVGGFA